MYLPRHGDFRPDALEKTWTTQDPCFCPCFVFLFFFITCYNLFKFLDNTLSLAWCIKKPTVIRQHKKHDFLHSCIQRSMDAKKRIRQHKLSLGGSHRKRTTEKSNTAGNNNNRARQTGETFWWVVCVEPNHSTETLVFGWAKSTHVAQMCACVEGWGEGGGVPSSNAIGGEHNTFTFTPFFTAPSYGYPHLWKENCKQIVLS